MRQINPGRLAMQLQYSVSAPPEAVDAVLQRGTAPLGTVAVTAHVMRSPIGGHSLVLESASGATSTLSLSEFGKTADSALQVEITPGAATGEEALRQDAATYVAAVERAARSLVRGWVAEAGSPWRTEMAQRGGEEWLTGVAAAPLS